MKKNEIIGWVEGKFGDVKPVFAPIVMNIETEDYVNGEVVPKKEIKLDPVKDWAFLEINCD